MKKALLIALMAVVVAILAARTWRRAPAPADILRRTTEEAAAVESPAAPATSSAGITGIAVAEQLQEAFSRVARQGSESVVSIYTEQEMKTQRRPSRHPFIDPEDQQGEPFDEMFRRFFEFEMPESAQKRTSLGSGIILDGAGHILTNAHVIEGADQITVQEIGRASCRERGE